MDVDPLASMRCWAITVTLGGREFEIPALPAADWWPVICEANPGAVLDILKSDVDLDEMILDGTVSGDDLAEVWRDAIEEATGRSFHVAFVLATVAAMNWAVVGGEMTRRGFRWDVQPIGAALDLIYATVTAPMGEKDLEKFRLLLENETLTSPGRKRAPSERVMTEFESMAGPRPAPSPLPGGASAAPSDSPRPRTRTQPRPLRQGARSGPPRKQPGAPGKSGPRASS